MQVVPLSLPYSYRSMVLLWRVINQNSKRQLLIILYSVNANYRIFCSQNNEKPVLMMQRIVPVWKILHKDNVKCVCIYHTSQGSFACTYTEQHTTAQGMLHKNKGTHVKCVCSYHAYNSQGSFTCTYTGQHTTTPEDFGAFVKHCFDQVRIHRWRLTLCCQASNQNFYYGSSRTWA